MEKVFASVRFSSRLTVYSSPHLAKPFSVSRNVMTTTLLKNIFFYSFFILTTILMLIPYAIFSVYELEYAMNIGFNNNILILIFAVIFYIIFRKKMFKSRFNNKYIIIKYNNSIHFKINSIL